MNNIKLLNPTVAELSKLNGDQLALVSAYLAGESYRELSFNFGIPIGTVKSRLHRAKAKLLENRELEKHGIYTQRVE